MEFNSNTFRFGMVGDILDNHSSVEVHFLLRFGSISPADDMRKGEASLPFELNITAVLG